MKLKIATLTIGVGLLSGCASTFNTADNSKFGCGLPEGQTCKTPTAVYNSTHSAMPMTQYDEPVVNAGVAARTADKQRVGEARMVAPGGSIYTHVQGPRPVREPAQIVRIWIAPWIDVNDNLNLAQYQFTEVRPRTWTVGLEETKSGGYVIPHLALTGIEAVQPSGVQRDGGGQANPGAPVGQGNPEISEALSVIQGGSGSAASALGGPR